jgi:hypothetical protein
MKGIYIVLVSVITMSHSFAQSGAGLSQQWMDRNVYKIGGDSGTLSEYQFLKHEIGNKRIVALGEATHGDGATFEARAQLINFLMSEMNFEVIIFEAGMFDLQIPISIKPNLPTV